MSDVRCTKTNLTNIFILKTLSRNATIAERFSEICETEVCLSRYRQCLLWNCCIQSRELLSNVHQSTSSQESPIIAHIKTIGANVNKNLEKKNDTNIHEQLFNICRAEINNFYLFSFIISGFYW